jgi:hypothetical protein
MAETRFTDTIEEKLALIAPTLAASGPAAINLTCVNFRGSSDSTWQALSSSLRDPGLDAAIANLYAAAAAVVIDTTMASQPLTRKRRLLKEAQVRFQERISTARPNARRACAGWRQDELFLAA